MISNDLECDCPLCNEYANKKNVLYETDNFFVVPSVGQIVEGYLLICSKRHYLAIADFEEKLLDEFEAIKEVVDKNLKEHYQKPIFFEHGAASSLKRGGCCIEHAHLHAVPVEIDILEGIKNHFEVKKIKSFHDLLGIKNPYLFYENPDGQKFLVEIPDVIPSQFLRKVIAVQIGKDDKWDWRTYAGDVEFENTLNRLKGMK